MTANVPTLWKHVATVSTGTVAGRHWRCGSGRLSHASVRQLTWGAFGVWMSIVAIATTVSSLRLEAAMRLYHDTTDQQACFSVLAFRRAIAFSFRKSDRLIAAFTLKQSLLNYTICYCFLYLMYLFLTYQSAEKFGARRLTVEPRGIQLWKQFISVQNDHWRQ